MQSHNHPESSKTHYSLWLFALCNYLADFCVSFLWITSYWISTNCGARYAINSYCMTIATKVPEDLPSQKFSQLAWQQTSQWQLADGKKCILPLVTWPCKSPKPFANLAQSVDYISLWRADLEPPAWFFLVLTTVVLEPLSGTLISLLTEIHLQYLRKFCLR